MTENKDPADMTVEEMLAAADEGFAEHQEVYDDMVARDHAARDAGIITGRYVQEQIADGHAYYVVEEIKDNGVCRMDHVDVWDGWHVDWIEDMGRLVPLALVEKNIARRDAIERMFRERT